VQVALSTGRELPMLAQALRERIADALPGTLPLDEWAERREQAVTLTGPARDEALGTLRRDIRRTVGVTA